MCRRGFSQSRSECWAASFATCLFVGSPLGSALAVSLHLTIFKRFYFIKILIKRFLHSAKLQWELREKIIKDTDTVGLLIATDKYKQLPEVDEVSGSTRRH